ncbi:carbon-nitrogen hydrolase family protein [Orbus wheelerorum]|uniref:carbon-nitrogen hydrolase family protein n=1 Tax=Orbus wheelerorum TaxID=3074111 RepID=UPI00370D2CEF
MTNSVTIAAIQMVSTQDLQQNLAKAKQLIKKAALQGAQFILLPEYFCLIHQDPNAKLTIAESFGQGPIQSMLSKIACEYKIWLAAGTIPLKSHEPNKVTNSLLLYAPDGSIHTRYDKVHLFSIQTPTMQINEGDTMVGGHNIVTADLPFGRVGFAICYDVRFPAFFAAMGELDLILMPAAFTYPTGQAHWELLLRARAIDNQCFVLAAAQGGMHQSGRQTWGHSMIIDPWASIIDCLNEGEGVVISTVDFSQVQKIRQILPVTRDRHLLDSL